MTRIYRRICPQCSSDNITYTSEGTWGTWHCWNCHTITDSRVDSPPSEAIDV